MEDGWLRLRCEFSGCDKEVGFIWDINNRDEIINTIRSEGFDMVDTRYFTVLCPDHKNRPWKIRKKSYNIRPEKCWTIYNLVENTSNKSYSYRYRVTSIGEALKFIDSETNHE